MSKRKATPSLMDNMLTGAPADAPAAASPADTAPPPAPAEDAYTPPPIKGTYYISPDADDALEEARRTLRRLLQPDRKHDVTKSKIVDAAILMAVQELREKGAESALARALG